MLLFYNELSKVVQSVIKNKELSEITKSQPQEITALNAKGQEMTEPEKKSV